MAKNKFYSLVFIALAMILAVQMVAATTTINTPIASGNYTGTVAVNVTTDFSNPLNVTCYYDADGGVVDSSDTQFTAIDNDSVADTEFTGSVTVSALTDAATYNITCIAFNDTANESATNVAGITIDNTAPTVTLRVLLDGDTTSYGSTVRHMCSISDSVDSSTTDTYAVAHPSGDATSSTTLTSGTSDFISFGDSDYKGDYVFTCSGTDYTGNTASDTATVTVNDLGWATGVTKENGSDLSGDNTWLLLIAAALLIYLFVNRK